MLSFRITFLTVIYFVKENWADVQVINHPQDVNVRIGEPAFLQCTFNTDVTCRWYHNGKLSSEAKTQNSRFDLIGNDNGNSGKNCILKIKSVVNEDGGVWKCLSHGSDKKEAVFSNPGKLTILEETKLNIAPMVTTEVNTPKDDQTTEGITGSDTIEVNLNPTLGSYVLLPCRKPTNSVCVWKRRNRRIKVTGRYIYASDLQPNCDLSIVSVTDIDYGKWTCLMTATDQRWSVRFSNVTLGDVQEWSHFSSNIIWIASLPATFVASICFMILLIYRLRSFKKSSNAIDA